MLLAYFKELVPENILGSVLFDLTPYLFIIHIHVIDKVNNYTET